MLNHYIWAHDGALTAMTVCLLLSHTCHIVEKNGGSYSPMKLCQLCGVLLFQGCALGSYRLVMRSQLLA